MTEVPFSSQTEPMLHWLSRILIVHNRHVVGEVFMWNWPMAQGKEETASNDSTPLLWPSKPREMERCSIHTVKVTENNDLAFICEPNSICRCDDIL